MTMLDKYSREELIENFEKQIEYTVKVDRVLQNAIKYMLDNQDNLLALMGTYYYKLLEKLKGENNE